MDSARPAAEAKGIELRAIFDKRGGLVLGDAGRLQQVVWNLLTNAIKYTNRGGRVAVRLERRDTYVALIVRDTGEGISPEFLPYIFDRFSQSDSTTTRKYGGLGLGLAIARHLVEAHRGTVRAESPGVGQGSTFTVTLPLMGLQTADLSTAVSAQSIPQSRILAGLSVLVVDDHKDTLELLAFALKKSEAEVMCAASAAEALKILDKGKPDLLVCDVGMPGEDGYDLIRKVRAREPERGGLIPAVALTGYASPEDAERAHAAGFQMHVPKPIGVAELIEAVASLAGRGRKV
jgi:CheY-like chemotaxis protein